MSNTVLLCWVLLCLCLFVSGPETWQTLRNEIKAISYTEMSSKLTDICGGDSVLKNHMIYDV